MTNVWLKARAFLFRNRAYILSVFLPVGILLTADVIFGIFPFGERAPLALDLNAQYVYYYEYMYDVFAGKESIFYSWSRSLSGEYLGLFAYYLASPFNLIVWLFPRANITEGILAMQLVKSAAVGFTSTVYLKKQRGFSDHTAALFSVMFAMCGYFTAHTINPMWLDGLIALPLVIMGVERVCDKRRFLLYTLSLLYIFVANYYIGYMVGIFSALYFVYYLLSGRSSVHGWRGVLKLTAVYGFSSVSAILLSGPIIIPVYKSLSIGKLAYGEPDYSMRENFNLADMLIKLFPGTYDTIRPDGLPMLYCGTLALIFAVIYFIMRKIPLRQRIAAGVLLGIFALSMYIKPVDMFWHGGQVPVWMPYRYSFIATYLLVIFGAEAFERFVSEKSKRTGSVGGAFAALLAVLLFSDYYEGNQHFDTTLIIVIPLCCLAIFAAVTAAFKKNRGKFAYMILSGTVCAELLLNCYITIRETHKDIYYSTRESYTSEIPPAREVMNELRETDDSFYRSEKTFHRTVNDPQALEMYGVSHSSSTYNTKVIALLKKLGYGARDHYSRYDGATMFSDDIFGIKYILSKRPDLVPYTDKVIEKNGITVYENTDALPLAFLADMGIIGSELWGSTPLEVQSCLAGLLTGDWYNLYHPISDVLFSSENVSIGSTTDSHISYKKRITSEGASVSYNVLMPHTGKAYAWFPTSYERECALYVNGNYIKNYFENENHTIVYLGTFNENDSFDVSLSLYKDDMYVREAMFFYLDENALENFSRGMSEKNARTKVTKTGHSSLEISVNAAEDCALFASIPFEEGWTALIDGEPAQLLPAVDGTLTSLRIPAGSHKITLKFFPAGLKTGLIMMVLGAVILAALIVLDKFGVPINTAAEDLSDTGSDNDPYDPENNLINEENDDNG
ncbi:MAG: YfhO family protein [Oscillospiraceae bacterium]|nr:YfhO family protein [Oscillospiraceae bacterium]